MDSLSILLVGIAVTSTVIYYLFFNDGNEGKKYPPGPRGFPLVGNLFSLGSKPHVAFTKWAKEYGPIVMMNLGRNRTIILNDVKLIKEAFNDPIFSGRPNNKAFSIVAGGKIGIINSDGDEWIEQRRFTLKTLRDFGFGRKSMESMIMDEVNEIINYFATTVGKPISVNRKFSIAVLNSLWAIMTSERYNHDDEKLKKILDTGIQAGKDANGTPIPLFFPEFASCFPRLTGWNKLVKAVAPMIDLFNTTVEERLRNPGDENHPRDFMDVYVNEINKTTDPNSSFYKQRGIKTLTAVIGDLHGAGSETTSTTLSWAVLYLMKYQEIQRKFQNEIDSIVGKSRLPCLADKNNMPYTEALMQEIFRYSSIAPMGLFHNTMADTIFHGYFIPKDTLIIGNARHVHFNPETWGDSDTFRPERFLSPDGKSVIKYESMIPFATGKRVCLGESLAREEFFLFMTSIFQRFQVNPDPTNPAALEAEIGFLQIPKEFTVIMKDRLE